jgi:hypothetical protein
MSHISKIELEVKDLATLKQACNRLGLNLHEGQRTFKWYGERDETCDHVIRVPEAAYEIGIIRTGDLYELKCDFWDSAIGKAIGKTGGLLRQAYAIERTKSEARRKGYIIIEKTTDSGVQLHVRVS